jgi:LacI family transcriptional regulator
MIGVIVDGSSNYGRDILRGVTRYANLQRTWMMHKDLIRLIETGSQWPKLDGVILGGVHQTVIDRGHAICRHMVVCSGNGDPKIGPVVALDDAKIGRLAAEHLIDCRLSRFAFYGADTGGTSQRRLDGFRQTLKERGYDCIESPVSRPAREEVLSRSHHPRLVSWIAELPKPIGILAIDDTAASDLADACVEADIAVPEHVAILGVNNDQLLCEAAWPPLSSVEADYTRVGFAAAKILDQLLAQQDVGARDRFVLLPPIGVVQRQSTNILAVDDPNLANALRFIREHACDPCSVSDVLRAVPVGRRWLERQFAAQFGRSPHDEIAHARIETAKRLLLQSDLRIQDIAFRSGFADIKSFYQSFGKVVGTAPAAFRRAAHLRKPDQST